MRLLILSTLALVIWSCTSLKPEPNLLAMSDRFQNDFLKRINKVRSSGCRCGKTYMPPVEPLRWNALLERSAYGHA